MPQERLATPVDTDAQAAERLATLLDKIVSNMVPGPLPPPSEQLSLTSGEARAMLWLAHNEHCLMSEFARSLALPLSTATRIADRLILKDLVVRQRSEQDRRVVRISMSPLGRRLADGTRKHGLKAALRMLSRLTEEQQTQLFYLLSLLSDGSNPSSSR